MGDAAVGALVAGGADGLGGLQLDEFLGDQAHRLACEVETVTRTDGLQQVGQGRL